MRPIPTSKLALVAACGMAALFALAPVPAMADYYQYTYTGNAFTVTTQTMQPWPGDPRGGRTFALMAMEVVIISDTLLSNNVALEDVRSFSITLKDLSGNNNYRRLILPAEPRPAPCPGCPDFGPFVFGSLYMSNFNELNQPYDWSISASSTTSSPTGRMDYLTLSTSGQMDMIDAGYETAYAQTGGLVNSPGVWAMAVLVPEPSTYLLMLGGGALLAGLARRQLRPPH